MSSLTEKNEAAMYRMKQC